MGRTLLLAVSFILTSLIPLAPVQADTEFGESVPTALVKALLGTSPYGETRLYSDILDDFPDFELPDGFTVMGSADRGFRFTVVVQTDLEEEAARDALTRAFTDVGYTPFNPVNARLERNGFIHPDQPSNRSLARLCHDREGFVSFSTNPGEDLNVVSISTSPLNGPGGNCAERLQQQNQAMSQSRTFGANSIRQYLPRMLLPESDPRRYQPFFGLGSSGSSRGVESRANLNIDWDIEQIYEHFKSQIEEQGWLLDSESVGSSSATGTWNRSPDPDTDLIGTLQIIMADDDVYEMKFTLVERGGGNRSAGGVFRVQ